MSESERMAYAGRCPKCGHLCAAAVDEPTHKRDTAKFVADMMRDGLNVERVTCEYVRQNLLSCECVPNPRRRKGKAPAVRQETLPLGAP